MATTVNSKIAGIGNAFGDLSGGNYAEFEADGTLKFNGNATYWRDIDFPIIIRTTGANIPTLATLAGNVTAPQWQVNDFNVCEGQELVHEWKEGSSGQWHIHVITNGSEATAKYLKFEIEWYVICNGDPISTIVTTTSGELEIPADTADRTRIVYNIGSPVSLANCHIGGHVYARLRRIAATGNAPAADPFCTMLQMHVECDTVGSRTISAK